MKIELNKFRDQIHTNPEVKSIFKQNKLVLFIRDKDSDALIGVYPVEYKHGVYTVEI